MQKMTRDSTELCPLPDCTTKCSYDPEKLSLSERKPDLLTISGIMTPLLPWAGGRAFGAEVKMDHPHLAEHIHLF